MISFGLKSEPYRVNVHGKPLLESLIICHSCLPADIANLVIIRKNKRFLNKLTVFRFELQNLTKRISSIPKYIKVYY